MHPKLLPVEPRSGLCSWMQSKQDIASASRAIVNYRLTCGLFASAFALHCLERGQDAALPGMRLPFEHTKLTGAGPFYGCKFEAPMKNALDLIRRAGSD